MNVMYVAMITHQPHRRVVLILLQMGGYPIMADVGLIWAYSYSLAWGAVPACGEEARVGVGAGLCIFIDYLGKGSICQVSKFISECGLL